MSAMASHILPASRLFTQPFIQAQIKENVKAPRPWPLCGEFTGHRWIPRTKFQERGKCFHSLFDDVTMAAHYRSPLNHGSPRDYVRNAPLLYEFALKLLFRCPPLSANWGCSFLVWVHRCTWKCWIQQRQDFLALAYPVLVLSTVLWIYQSMCVDKLSQYVETWCFRTTCINDDQTSNVRLCVWVWCNIATTIKTVSRRRTRNRDSIFSW